MDVWAASIGLGMLAAGLAWAVAVSRPRHRPAAALISVVTACNVLRQGLAKLNAEAYVQAAGAPLSGWARVNFHVDELLFLAWPAGLAASAALVFQPRARGGRAARLVGLAWGLAWLVQVLGYPTLRRALLARFYVAVELSAVAFAIACIVGWWPRRRDASIVELTIFLLLAVEITSLVGRSPWPFGAHWEWALFAYFLGYGVLVVVHGGVLWLLSKSRSSWRSW